MSINRSVVYACVVLILLGIILTAIPFFTSALDSQPDIEGERFFSFSGKYGDSLITSEGITLNPQSIFEYYDCLIYVSYSYPNVPGEMTGTLTARNFYTNSIEYVNIFEFKGSEQPKRLPIEVQNSGYYALQVQFYGFSDDYRIAVNVYRKVRVPLMIGLGSLATGVVMLSIILLMSKRQKNIWFSNG